MAQKLRMKILNRLYINIIESVNFFVIYAYENRTILKDMVLIVFLLNFMLILFCVFFKTNFQVTSNNN